MTRHELSAVPTEFRVKARLEGKRIDAYLAARFPDYSRSVIQKVIDAGAVQINGNTVTKASYRVQLDDVIRVHLPDLPDVAPQPEDIPLRILFEDEFLVVLDKPPGLVMHPAKGHWSGTLVNALAFHFQNLSSVGGAARPGIVHRLDRDTSGLLLIAKEDQAHQHLAAQFETRSIRKEYLALVHGAPDRDRDWVEKPIGFHPTHREKMAIRDLSAGAKPAQTYFEVLERFRVPEARPAVSSPPEPAGTSHLPPASPPLTRSANANRTAPPGRDFALLRCEPKTGRTHQIRVHLNHIGHPILADALYSGRPGITRADLFGPLVANPDLPLLHRQALHAHRLEFTHPASRQTLQFVSELPPDIRSLLDLLRNPV
jgi:23S rRNA pseudouridine1911/1915/1917 synthase